MQHAHSTPAGERIAETEGQMGAWAPYYDWLMIALTLGRERALREKTVDLAGIQPGHHVLEIGCGTGTLTLAAQRRAGPTGHVQGVDAAPEMVEAARRKAARASAPIMFQVGRIEDLPLEPGQFDVVLCSFMIFHMPDEARRKGLSEIYRVLKPGGRLLVVDFAAPAGPSGHPRGLVGLFARHMPSHDIAELPPELEQAGFSRIETGPAGFPMVSFVRATRP